MYICKECKKEYLQKVEYCECGNNTFDYIEVENKTFENKKNVKNTLSVEQKSEIVSKVFFIICLILSITVWLIPINSDKGKNEPKQSKAKQIKVKNIPDIDKIWDDTPQYTPIQQNNWQQSEVINREQTIPLTSTSADYARRIETPKYAENKVVKKKSTDSVNIVPKTKDTKTTAYNKNYLHTNENIKQIPKQQENSAPKYNPNSKEMLKYKGDLRAALFSKFALGGIQGSGSCEIQFSVDKSGKLINRKFTQESSNKTLNDTVYYMLMSLPRFNPPPQEYNGTPIQMKFSIYNGNYEISIN